MAVGVDAEDAVEDAGVVDDFEVVRKFEANLVGVRRRLEDDVGGVRTMTNGR